MPMPYPEKTNVGVLVNVQRRFNENLRPRQCYGSRRLSGPAYWPANTAARPGSSSTKKTASSQSSVADRPRWDTAAASAEALAQQGE